MEFLACDEFASFAQSDNFIAIIAITFGSLIGISGVIGATLGGIMRTRAQEQTKRELAAYVAEGSLDPDKAVAMLNTGMKKRDTPDIGECC